MEHPRRTKDSQEDWSTDPQNIMSKQKALKGIHSLQDVYIIAQVTSNGELVEHAV